MGELSAGDEPDEERQTDGESTEERDQWRMYRQSIEIAEVKLKVRTRAIEKKKKDDGEKERRR